MQLLSPTRPLSSSAGGFGKLSPGPFPIDDFTALIAHISRLDLAGLDAMLAKCASPKGSSLSDEELAIALFAQEAEGLLHIAKDHTVQGLDDAAKTDVLLEELLQLEQDAQRDHAIALALTLGNDPDDPDSLLDELLREDEDEKYDHAVAIALSQGIDPPPRPGPAMRRGRPDR